jgi:YD repeat-containing protein
MTKQGVKDVRPPRRTKASYSFTLDGAGNRTGIIQTEPDQTLPSMGSSISTYNLQKNRLLSSGGGSFTYDDEGQIATGYGSAYTFDYEHRLTAIGQSSSFSYDGMGNRLEAVRNSVTTRYIYDAQGNLMAEADGDNVITRYYIHGAGLLAMVTPSDHRQVTG